MNIKILKLVKYKVVIFNIGYDSLHVIKCFGVIFHLPFNKEKKRRRALRSVYSIEWIIVSIKLRCLHSILIRSETWRLTVTPCECGLIRPRTRPCIMSAARRLHGTHLTSHECTVRARTHTPLPTAPVLSWSDIHRKPRGDAARTAQAKTTRQRRVADQLIARRRARRRLGAGGEEKSRATELMSVRPIGGGGGPLVGKTGWVGENPRAIPPLSKVKEGGASLCCRHVR